MEAFREALKRANLGTQYVNPNGSPLYTPNLAYYKAKVKAGLFETNPERWQRSEQCVCTDSDEGWVDLGCKVHGQKAGPVRSYNGWMTGPSRKR